MIRLKDLRARAIGALAAPARLWYSVGHER